MILILEMALFLVKKFFKKIKKIDQKMWKIGKICEKSIKFVKKTVFSMKKLKIGNPVVKTGKNGTINEEVYFYAFVKCGERERLVLL
jgi:DNA polymerase III delta prime subunit